LLLLVEQRVTPLDRGTQRLLTPGNVAGARCEQVEGIVEALEQVLGGQEPQSGRGELE
jgi:hypothetical protein